MDDRMQKFAILVDAGSFTLAAKRLHISQPALTVAMKKLEKELGSQLLISGVRPLRPTKAGKLVYKAALQRIEDGRQLIENIEALRKRRLQLRIGMIDSVATLLAAYPQVFSDLEESAEISLIVNNSRYLKKELSEGRLDVVYAVELGREDAVFEQAPLAADPLILVCSHDQQNEVEGLVSKGSIPRFIAYDRSSNTFRLVDSNLTTRNIEATVRFYSSSPEVMLRMVIAGQGVAVLPFSIAHDFLVNGNISLARQNGQGVVIPRQISRLTYRGSETADALRVLDKTLKEAFMGLEEKTSGAIS